MICSVQPSKYIDLLNQSGKKVISYLLLLCFLLSVMQFVIPAAGWFASFGGLEHLIQEVLPAIELSGGKLHVEDRIEIGAGSSTYVVIDTTKDSVTEKDIEKDKYLAQILVSRDNVLIYNMSMGTTEIRFADLGNVTLGNKELLVMIPFIYLILLVSFVTHMFSQMFDLILWGTMMSLCCWGPFRLKGTKKLCFAQVLSLAIYAQTAMRLVVAVNSCVNFMKDDYMLYYIGIMASMFFLMSGLRKMAAEEQTETESETEEDLHE
jgi:hypothetical protein